MAYPVSNPATLVTYGYNRIVRQILTVKRFFAAPVSAINLGTVSEADAAAPAAAVKAGGVGAKLMLTVAVPAGGEFWATLET